MQVQPRLVRRSDRLQALAITQAVTLALALLTLVLVSVALHNAQISTSSPRIAVLSSALDRQAPDAKERNDAYAQALAARFRNQSPDAQQRNEQLTAR